MALGLAHAGFLSVPVAPRLLIYDTWAREWRQVAIGNLIVRHTTPCENA